MNPLLSTAIEAAYAAGKEIMGLYKTTDFDTKLDGSPVTIADTRAHTVLMEHLTPTGIATLSEEAEGVALPYPTRMWIIDPLDGTKDFLKQTKDFSVMIGLIENGEPILGVVYAPALKKLYYAEKGNGTYVVANGVTTKLAVSPSPDTLRFICSVHNFAPYMETVITTLGAQKSPRGSVGVKAGIIADGEGEFFLSRGALGEWDVCAPQIILEEAGGTVTDTKGNKLRYGTSNHRIEHGMIFSNGDCHAQVLEALQGAD